jgi:hypothetical protein
LHRMMAMPLCRFPLGASILEVYIVRDKWLFAWRSAVISSASTTTSLNGVALSSVVVALMADQKRLVRWSSWRWLQKTVAATEVCALLHAEGLLDRSFY